MVVVVVVADLWWNLMVEIEKMAAMMDLMWMRRRVVGRSLN